MHLIPVLLLVLSVLVSGGVSASPLTDAEALLRAGKLSEARARLQSLSPSTAADAERRDWALAVTHVRSGAPKLAVPLLDRLVSSRPGDGRYRLELGMALLRSGASGRARHHLDLVRGARGLDPQTRAGLDAVLRRIEAPKLWEGYLRFALVPESNAVRRTGADSLFIGGDRIVLNPNARAMPATGLQLDGGFAFLPRLGPDLRGRIGLRSDVRFYEKSQLNDVTLKAETGIEGTTRSGAHWVVVGTLSRRDVGNTAYSRGHGVRVGWASRVGQAGHLRLRAEHETLRHRGAWRLNGPRSLLALTYSQVLAPNLLMHGTVFANRARTRIASENADGLGVVMGLQYGFAGGLVVDLDLALGRSDRRGVDRLFGVVRHDTRTGVTARIKHRDLRLSGFTPVLEMGHERQKSTIALNSYRNTRLSLGLSRDF